MACFHPVECYRKREGGITFRPEEGVGSVMRIRCGKCVGCRTDHAKTWAVRCVCEAQMHEENCFLTLTYDDEHLPTDGGLQIRHLQLFMKNLRKRVDSDSKKENGFGKKIRFFACGEYGEKNFRPHYHVIIFGHDFQDRVLHSIAGNNRVDTSNDLQRLWPHGFSTVGNLTFESAGYVARYALKKIDSSGFNYETLDFETGELQKIRKEFIVMSRRPGIGLAWYKKYKSDVFPDDFVVVKGHRQPVPKYFSEMLKIEDEVLYEKLKYRKVRHARKHSEDQTPRRLQVREKVFKSRIELLKRNI